MLPEYTVTWSSVIFTCWASVLVYLLTFFAFYYDFPHQCVVFCGVFRCVCVLSSAGDTLPAAFRRISLHFNANIASSALHTSNVISSQLPFRAAFAALGVSIVWKMWWFVTFFSHPSVSRWEYYHVLLDGAPFPWISTAEADRHVRAIGTRRWAGKSVPKAENEKKWKKMKIKMEKVEANVCSLQAAVQLCIDTLLLHWYVIQINILFPGNCFM